MMMLASSSQNYFGDAWNVFDFIIVLGSFIDIIYTEVNVSTDRSRGVSYYTLTAPPVFMCMYSFRRSTVGLELKYKTWTFPEIFNFC